MGAGVSVMFCVLSMKCFAILLGTTINKAYSVVARVVEPELDDEARWPCGEAERRLEGVRDPREVGLRVLLEAAGVSDSHEVRVRVIGGYLSAGAEE